MKVLLIMIPGNPSVPGLYEGFVDRVSSTLPIGTQKICKVLSHLGQCNEKLTKKDSITIQDVIDDHKETITKEISNHSADKVIIMGHSLGCAITMALHSEFTSKVDQFVMICPFTGPSKRNTRFLKVFQNPITRQAIKGLTHLALYNKKVSSSVMKKLLGENPFNELIIKEIKRPLYLKNFLLLLSSYIVSFKKLNIKEQLKTMNAEKSFFIFVPDDYWVPQETMNHLPENSNFYICEEASHDFCLFADQYNIVAELIRDHFNKIDLPA